MDAVILAAGRGERLRDLTPAFHKPLLPIDGVPLVCRSVDLVENVADRVVVVVAPANAEAISGALGSRDVFMVVQREPTGPGEALFQGLQLCLEQTAMVLLSDNVVSQNDVERILQTGTTCVGTKYMPRADAVRFTRYEDHRWIEKEPLTPYGEDVLCWVGPFVGHRRKMLDKFASLNRQTPPYRTGETLIGPYLGEFMLDDWETVLVDSYDVGTLASYPAGGKIK